MGHQGLKEYSFFEQVAVAVVAYSEEEALAIARAGGGDRSSEAEYQPYCESTVEENRKPSMGTLDVKGIPLVKSICVNDRIISDEADRDPRIAEFRKLAEAAGWVKIWFTPYWAMGKGPSIVHWPTFADGANENDSVYDNWEVLVWECCLADIDEPQDPKPHMKWKHN